MAKKSNANKTSPTANKAKKPTLAKPSNKGSLRVTRRQSLRLHNQLWHAPAQGADRVIEEIDLTVNDSEGEANEEDIVEEPGDETHEPANEPETEQTLAERVMELTKTVEELKPKARIGEAPSEGTPTSVSYKSLYFGAQKKSEELKIEINELGKKLEERIKVVEELMAEKHELQKKLDVANGKIEEYEKMVGGFTSKVVDVLAASRPELIASVAATATVMPQKTATGKRRR